MLWLKWSEVHWQQTGSLFSLCRWSNSSCRHCFSPSGYNISWMNWFWLFLFRLFKAKITWGGGGSYLLKKLYKYFFRVFFFRVFFQTRTMCQDGVCVSFHSFWLALEMWINENDWHGILRTWRSRSLMMHYIWFEGPARKIYCNAAFVALVPLIPVSVSTQIHILGCCKNVLCLIFMWNSSKPSSFWSCLWIGSHHSGRIIPFHFSRIFFGPQRSIVFGFFFVLLNY